ncbi:MAG: RNA polymerase factor sigma-54 [candidate division WOR-3 bacterium]|nr:RNA polymerase factor sigma-54 [candidate division WOR-3 bacterium]
MKYEQKNELKLKQELTPQLIELLKILQMPRLELQQLIHQEIEQNPFLDNELDQESDEDEGEEEEIEEEDMLPFEDKIDYEYFFHKEWKSSGTNYSRKSKEDSDFNPVDIYSRPVGFKEQLLTQIHFEFSDEEIVIAEFILSSLSDDGLLKDSVDEETGEIISTVSFIKNYFGISSEHLEDILRRFRHLSPIGVGSRTVRESLLTQLKAKSFEDTLAYTIIDRFYDDLLKNKLYRIITKLDIDEDELKEAIECIKKLNPKPASGEWGTHSNYVVPDILVERKGDKFVPMLNTFNFPEVHLNRKYLQMLQNKDKLNKKEVKFLKKRLNSAIFLVSGIHKRQATLMKIAERIVMLQKEFFRYGVSALKPMILADIADYIGVHESTVSRATENKYMDTPQGLYPVKFFFSRGIMTEQGETSNRNVRDLLNRIIENEDKRKPLTDKKLAEILSDEHHIDIARRTVAKYREQLGILAASKRKNYFKEEE